MYYRCLTIYMNSVKVSSKGQIVIPEDIRKKLGLEKGSIVKVVLDGNKIVLMSAVEPPKETIVSAGPKMVKQVLKESKSSDEKKLKALLKALVVKE